MIPRSFHSIERWGEEFRMQRRSSSTSTLVQIPKSGWNFEMRRPMSSALTSSTTMETCSTITWWATWRRSWTLARWRCSWWVHRAAQSALQDTLKMEVRDLWGAEKAMGGLVSKGSTTMKRSWWKTTRFSCYELNGWPEKVTKPVMASWSPCWSSPGIRVNTGRGAILRFWHGQRPRKQLTNWDGKRWS